MKTETLQVAQLMLEHLDKGRDTPFKGQKFHDITATNAVRYLIRNGFIIMAEENFSFSTIATITDEGVEAMNIGLENYEIKKANETSNIKRLQQEKLELDVYTGRRNKISFYLSILAMIISLATFVFNVFFKK